MKKLLFVLALGVFAACNNGGTDAATDSTSVKLDTPASVTGTLSPDSASSGAMTTDTTGMTH